MNIKQLESKFYLDCQFMKIKKIVVRLDINYLM